MLFNTVQFFVFLAATLLLFYLSPWSGRKPILLVASYFFYGCWNVKFIPLLLGLTAIDYTVGLLLEGVRPRYRKLALIGGLAANLGFLGFFKYSNFIGSNLAWLLGRPAHAFFIDVILPLGISFHTLQSISYIVDVYRGEQRAVRNPLDYALFISFFPQLVAGPIVRARVFFRDLLDWHPPTREHLSEGLLLVTLGLTKKMAFADQFAKLSDAYFADMAANPGTLTAWSAMFAFSIQIYFDFSGYTDMAIGMAKLFGFHFPVNFRRPYLSASVTEFWRRWHVSLSTWLRDYLYIPLGGNRHGKLMTYRNLMLTMILGGLWHGASWNFAIWGGLHGVFLSAERLVRGQRRFTEARTWVYPLQLLFTFTLITLTRVFFRATSLGQSLEVLKRMFTLAPGRLLLEPWHLAMVAVSLGVALLEEKRNSTARLVEGPIWAYAAALCGMFVCLEWFGVVDASIPFVYFQF